MSKEPIAEGGSYVVHKDGTLERVAGTAPAATPGDTPDAPASSESDETTTAAPAVRPNKKDRA